MKLKTIIRLKLDNILDRYGYKMVRKYQLEPRMVDYNLLLERDEYPLDEAAQRAHEQSDEPLTLNWIIPLLGRGSGGHMTIFRTIRLLSEQGIRHRIYMCWDDSTDYSSADLRGMVKDFYGYDLGDNEIYWDHRKMGYADGVVATSWQSAYVARRFHNCRQHFYFVQDFEPWFYPKGSLYSLSENTYHFGFKGITAGLFLSDKLNRDYGMDCFGFRFSYDRNLYRYVEKPDDKKRIFFYARPYTARREFEVGVLALTMLHEKHPDMEVIMAGQKVSDFPFAFPVRDMGIMAPNEMSALYSMSDLCLVLSATNLSLLPLEVMASGSVVVSDRGEHNEWELNDENAILCDADPWDLCDRMDYYLTHPDELKAIREKGRAYAEGLTWEDEMEKLAAFIRDNI